MNFWTLLASFFLCLSLSSPRQHGMPDANSLTPIILMPGLGGSSLQVEIDKTYKKAWECFQKWSWWGIWVNIYEIAFQTCWFDNLQLHYFPGNDTFQNNPGVLLRPNDFGGLNGVNKVKCLNRRSFGYLDLESLSNQFRFFFASMIFLFVVGFLFLNLTPDYSPQVGSF